MERQHKAMRAAGDSLELLPGDQIFEKSPTAWLISQGLRYLHHTDEGGGLAYRRVKELLADRRDAEETLIKLVQDVPADDISLRWSLLYLLGQVAGPAAAEFLARLAVEPLPEQQPGKGCEGPRDGEVLVRTMAVEALQWIAGRHPEAGRYLLKIVSEHPGRPILIEAVKAASDLGLKDRVGEMLSDEDRWILDIRRAPVEEIGADPERKDTPERGFTPPKGPSEHSAPHAGCCDHKEG